MIFTKNLCHVTLLTVGSLRYNAEIRFPVALWQTGGIITPDYVSPLKQEKTLSGIDSLSVAIGRPLAVQMLEQPVFILSQKQGYIMLLATLPHRLITTTGLLFLLLSSPALFAANQVSTSWLAKNLDKPDLVLIDMDESMQYQRFHIPGARHLPYAAINRRNKMNVSLSIGAKGLRQVLGQMGISSRSLVIIYDDFGGLHAGRLYWELTRLGHSQVAILNGGLVQWIHEGRKVTQAITPIKATSYALPADHASGEPNLASLEDVLHRPANSVLLDVRSKEEYTGTPRAKRSGHIPGARWWAWDNSVDFAQGFKLKADGELKRQLKRLGLLKTDTPVILYCHSAHRASQTYYTLRKLGFSKVKVYDGSMAEYGIRKDLPLKTGMAP